MVSLQMTEVKAEKMGELEDMSMDTIKKALKGEKESDSEEVKISVKVLGIVAKTRQTLTNRSAIDFGMATSIASDKELKKYIEVTSPHIKKALVGKVA